MMAGAPVLGLVLLMVAKELMVTADVVQQSIVVQQGNEKGSPYWHMVADNELKEVLRPDEPTLGRARNVVLFIGGGLGPTSVTAGRILAGQKKGLKGEEYRLSFDKFPHTGLAVTYSVDRQTTDSAAAATALTCGVKTNHGVIGMTANVNKGVCPKRKTDEVESILRWFLKDGRSAGVVATTKITHDTPASTYAHSPDGKWESDTQITRAAKDAGCKDIALQLIEDNSDINVILGGGMNYFKPPSYIHPHSDRFAPNRLTVTKGRSDGKDLVQDWQDDKASKGLRYKFVLDKKELDSVDTNQTDYLFGLFAELHMAFEIDRDSSKEPSLAEMTEKAIQVLQNNEKGFFLLVEGGRIDHAHHDSKASKALHDVIAFADAVDKAVSLTDKSDTLILVTGDHSLTMSIAGDSVRGNNILGKSNTPGLAKATDRMPYTTLLYATGPGYVEPRQDLSNVDTADKEYQSQSAVHMESGVHGGEDVTMYARGPQSYLVSGVHENNYIPMMLAYASCVGPYQQRDNCAMEITENAGTTQQPQIVVFTCALLLSLIVTLSRDEN